MVTHNLPVVPLSHFLKKQILPFGAANIQFDNKLTLTCLFLFMLLLKLIYNHNNNIIVDE